MDIGEWAADDAVERPLLAQSDALSHFRRADAFAAQSAA